MFACKGYLGGQIKDSEDIVLRTLGGELSWPAMLVCGVGLLEHRLKFVRCRGRCGSREGIGPGCDSVLVHLTEEACVEIVSGDHVINSDET